MKSGNTLQQLAKELDRQNLLKRDYILPASQARHVTDSNGVSTVYLNSGKCRVDGYAITPLASQQLADKLNIPMKYFEFMRTKQPDLLDNNVNTWLQSTDAKKMMVRTLDNKVRAILSPRYRRRDNFALVESILPVLANLPGARGESLAITENRLYLKWVSEKLQFELEKGDIIRVGVVISNSEVGLGKTKVAPLVYRCVCGNGAIIEEEGLCKAHIGREADCDGDYQMFSDETLEADDRAFFMKVHDAVAHIVSESTLNLIGARMQKTMGISLSGDPVASVSLLANRYNMSSGEKGGVLAHLIRGHDLSAFGLLNAVTRFSQDIQDYDRATDFEEIGGKLIALPPDEWRVIAAAAN